MAIFYDVCADGKISAMSVDFQQNLRWLAEKLGTIESVDDDFVLCSGPYDADEATSIADNLKCEFPGISVKTMPHNPLSELNEYNAQPVRDTLNKYYGYDLA